MTFSVLFTFTDFQLIYVLTRGGPLNATHLMATLSFQRAISGGALGEGAAIAIAMVPFLLAAILFSYFGLQRRAWQQGGRQMTRSSGRRRRRAPLKSRRRSHVGMDYLDRCRAGCGHGLPAAASCSCSCCCSRSTGWRSPRSSRTTSCCRATGNPFWVIAPTLAHFKKLLFDTAYPEWMWNTVLVSVVATFVLAGRVGARRLRDRAAALPGLASRSGWRSSSPTWCRRRSCSSRWPPSSSSSACSTRAGR